jgi:hypothetical protein
MSYILKLGSQNFTAVSSSGTTHKNLNDLQGGTTDEYYHLTSASYVSITSNTSSNALTSSYPWFDTGSNIAYVGGNVGINTATPTATLQIAASDITAKSAMAIRAISSPTYGVDADFELSSIGYLAFNPVRADVKTTGLSIGWGATNIGNVGIGILNPTSKLHIYQTASSANAIVKADNATVNTFFGLAGGGTAAGLGTITNHPVMFYANNTELMRLSSSGNFGIGSSTPTTKLYVAKSLISGYDDSILTFSEIGNNGNNGSSIVWNFADNGLANMVRISGNRNGANAAGNLCFSTYGTPAAITERMRINYAGNVGIGTTNPLAKLQISNDGSSSIEFSPGVTAFTLPNINYISSYNRSSSVFTDLIFDTNGGAPSLMLKNGGNVGIGTITPGYLLDVRGSAAIYGSDIDSVLGDSIIFGNVNYPTSYKNKIQNAVSSQANQSYMNFALSTGAATSANVLTLRGDGTVGIGVTVPSYKLDVRNGVVSNVAADVASLGYRIQNSGTGGRIYALVSGIRNVGQIGFSIYDETATVTRLTINDSGSIGIGTTSPQELLHVQGNISCSNLLGTASLAISASYAPGGSLSGTSNYIPKWNGGGTTLTSTSSIYDGLSTVTTSYYPGLNNWQPVYTNTFTINQFYDIIYASGSYVVVGAYASATTNAIITSPDGITWTSRTSSLSGEQNNAIVYAQTGSTDESKIFVVVSSRPNSAITMQTSPDAVTWTARSLPSYYTNQSDDWRGVAYGTGTFVAVGRGNQLNNDSVVTSPNSITWTGRSASYVDSQNTWNDVCYAMTGSTSASGIFVAVGNTSPGVATSTIMTSPDGINWTSRTSSLATSNNSFNCISYLSGTFVAGGLSIITSPDGITWTTQVSSFSYGASKIIYVSGTFIAACGIGNMTRTNCIFGSTDLINWTSLASTPTPAPAKPWHSLTYNDNKVIAVGTGNSPTSSIMMSAFTASLTTNNVDIVNITKPLYVNNSITMTSITSSNNPVITTRAFDGTYLPVVVNGITKYIPLYT